MSLPTEEFPLPKRSPTPRTIQEVPANGAVSNDSLIAKGWQREQYVGIAILFAGLIAVIGFFSRRFEYALVFAISLSIILIVFFLTA
ncbi:hypothetical protein Cylst_4116 [Cylindrospermum stagnale PCC 7417]|uniref:Uncharacterized protein n=1 Tax=Cylindrospermum stagnale PCC 7417 TaxID=56107 RepID=K9X2E2_9NOST|nr:hypothetical protein [Cylindrospermum stagnale]AFZ26221.1 hypothetical protein Cylst_4116 [Cylindrospermum stagnale PCC 7417]